ncbi:MAG: hypothetical protein ACWGKN_09430 [Desulfoprunum sp.]
MSNYKQMTVEYLQQHDPDDLKRMENEGVLEEFLEGIEKDHRETERTIFKQMTENLPEDDLKRSQEENRARDVAREISTSYLNEFLTSL